MSISGIQLVTFDVTNTLLKFCIPPWEYYALVAKKYGYKGSGTDLKSKLLSNYKVLAKTNPNFGKETISWQQWWTKVIDSTFQGGLPSNVDMNKIAKELIEDFKTSKCWKKAEGCDEIIHLLRQAGITIGVISNIDPRLHDILFNLNLHECFDFILTSYECGISKPDRSIFKIAQEKCKKNIDSSNCLHIGDDLINDYQGARAANWQAILVTDKQTEEIKLIKSQVYPNLKVLCKMMENNLITLA